jgi:alpha-1,2-mannosyltransferase
MGRKLLIITIFTFNLLLCCLYLRPLRDRPVWDLTNFYLVGRIVRSGHVSQIYNKGAYEPLIAELRKTDEPASRFSLYYNRPAFELPLFLPLAYFSFPTAKMLAIVTNLLLIGAAVWKLPQWLNCPGMRLWLFAFMPFLHTVAFGQDDILLTLILAYGLRLGLDNRDRPAGVILALAAFKPQVIFLLPFVMVAARRWKMLCWFLGTGLALSLFSLALVGFQGTREWVGLLQAPTTDFAPDLMGNLRALGIHWGVFPAAFAGIVTVAAFSTVLVRRTSFAGMFSAALLTGLLLSPHSYMQDYSVLAIVALVSLPRVAMYFVLLPWPFFYGHHDMLPFILLAVVCLVILAMRRLIQRSIAAVYNGAERALGYGGPNAATEHAASELAP